MTSESSHGLARFLIAFPLLLPLAGQQPRPQPEATTFRVQVNVVNLFFNVRNRHGALLPDLKREDFEVFEDGQRQAVKYFSAESDLPLTLGLLIDTSGSQQYMLPLEQKAGAEFVREVIREKDVAFLMNFDLDVGLVQDFTSSHRELVLGLERLQINKGESSAGPVRTKRLTALFDAIHQASREKLAPVGGRKALVILTDGQDHGSRVKIREAIESAQKADASCYVLLIANGFDSGVLLPVGYDGDIAMKKIATETGGRLMVIGTNQKKLRAAFDQISAELRSQYSIGYTPTNAKRDGSYRKVEIKAKNARIQARKGYYAARD